jgi:hypothetical protein
MHGATGIMDGATEIMDEATGIRDERTDGLFDHVILRRTRVELDQLRLVVIREMACSSSKMVFPVPAPLLRLRTNIANVTLARAFADRHISSGKQPSSKSISSLHSELLTPISLSNT